MENEQFVKGFAFKKMVDYLKKIKGHQILEIIDKKLGESNFSPVKDYPLELYGKLNDLACEILYGENNPENYRKLGHLFYDMNTDGPIVKTLISQMNSFTEKAQFDIDSLYKMLKIVAKVIRFFTPGITVLVEKVSPYEIHFVQKNNPHPIEYSEGCFEAATQGFFKTPNSKENLNSIEWKQIDKSTQIGIFKAPQLINKGTADF